MKEIKNVARIISISIGVLVAMDYIYGMFYYNTFILAGLGQKSISILMAISSISLLLFDFPSGNISDIIGRKKTGAIGIVLWGIGLLIFSLSKNFYLFFLAVIIFNLGISLETGSLTSWLHTYLSKRDSLNIWDKVIASIDLYVNIIKFFLNGILLLIVNLIKFNILLFAGIILIFLGLFIYIWKNSEDNYGSNNKLALSIISNIKYILRNKSMIYLVGIRFLSSIFLSSFLLIFPYKFIYVLGFDKMYLPYLYFLFNFVILLASIIYKKILLNRWDISNIYRWNIILGLISVSILILSNNIYIYFLSLILFELFFTINMTTYGTFQWSYYEEDRKAALVSAVSAIGSLSSAISFILVGIFLERTKYLYVLSIIVIVYAIGILLLANKLFKIKIEKE